MSDQTTVWDVIVSKSKATTPSNTPTAVLAKLPLRPTPDVRYLPQVERRPDGIPNHVRQTIREASATGIKWPLYLVGNPGTGKTCAGLCIADYCPGAWWVEWPEFWRFVNDVNFRRAETEIRGVLNEGGWREPSATIKWNPARWWRYAERLSCFVLDDLGTGDKATALQYEALKTLLDRRQKKPLIVTSNVEPLALKDTFDARIVDRLDSGTVVKLSGKSRR